MTSAVQNVLHNDVRGNAKRKENDACNYGAVFKPRTDNAKTVTNGAARSFSGGVERSGAENTSLIQNGNVADKLVLCNGCFKLGLGQANTINNVFAKLKPNVESNGKTCG